MEKLRLRLIAAIFTGCAFRPGIAILPRSSFLSPSSVALQRRHHPPFHFSRSPFPGVYALRRTRRKAHDPPVLDDVCETTGVTFTRFLAEVTYLNSDMSELTTLMSGISTATKAISNLVRRNPLPSDEMLGTINKKNMGDETLEHICGELLKRALRFTGRIGVLASEEEEDSPVDLFAGTVLPPNSNKELLFDETSRYVAVFDPLDGPRNVDAGMPTGTIFGVFGHDDSCDVNDPDACLIETIRSGSNLVASGYCLYGSSTFLMFTMGNGAYGFTLDENVGEFILSHPDIKIPERSSTYSFNEARERMWEDPVRDVVAKWRAGTGKSARIFSSRYVGSMVGDVHRTLLNGGIFGYPADDMYPEGKLRLLYEGAPMSFLMEQAGGMSTTGRERVMDVQPSYVHQRVPIMMGSAEDVREIIEACKEWDEGIGL